MGLLPHLLHHLGPLVGTALVAGTGGTILFAALGLVASIPFLLQLRRRFNNWVAPGIALAVFAATFSITTFLIGPLISGERNVSSQGPTEHEPGANNEHGHTAEQ